MQRLYSTFPGRWPGVGLLLLRGAVGAWAAVEGGAHLVGGASAWWMSVVGALAVVSGTALLVGFLTPVAGFAVAALSVGRALTWIPPPVPHLLDDGAGALFLVTVSVGLVLLGPGAFSIDSYLFGRREIIIPHEVRSPRL